jgi:hypothetical protein
MWSSISWRMSAPIPQVVVDIEISTSEVGHIDARGKAKRKMFYGPGLNNFDVALHKVRLVTESKILEFRFEAFNIFNHAQFDPNGSVEENINTRDSDLFSRPLRHASHRSRLG